MDVQGPDDDADANFALKAEPGMSEEEFLASMTPPADFLHYDGNKVYELKMENTIYKVPYAAKDGKVEWKKTEKRSVRIFKDGSVAFRRRPDSRC
jgi:hypothetical protein